MSDAQLKQTMRSNLLKDDCASILSVVLGTCLSEIINIFNPKHANTELLDLGRATGKIGRKFPDVNIKQKKSDYTEMNINDDFMYKINLCVHKYHSEDICIYLQHTHYFTHNVFSLVCGLYNISEKVFF